DFRAPLKSSPRVEEAKAMLREKVAFYDKDRYFAPDIEQANALLKLAIHNHLMPGQLFNSY
ncbi:histidine ammonia-lyase, partial [Vibrio genomosp. F10 str. 9ZD137]